MDLSLRWLKEFVDVPDMPLRQFTEAITMSGSKVESWRTEGEEIHNVVVGRVLSLEKHPDSDHLWITQVSVTPDQAPLQIVTGAQNLEEGDWVPVALHNSALPGGKKIKKGKLRGVESNGMLCSLGELGLSKHDFPSAVEDGIMVLTEQDGCRLELGLDIREALRFDDTTVEFEITSNRPDCFSVIGLAREAAATFDLPLKLHKPAVKGGHGDCTPLLDVKVEAPELCALYANRIVKNVRVKPSPLWMRERLRAMGVRPINNMVDITNYVMLEYGQPMHAFDLRSVAGGKIRVRTAKPGEQITTLDGTLHKLTETQLVIADAEKPMAIAGVMGGKDSGIFDDTNTLVFESACFDGVSVRTTARDQGLRTEASSRFEKGLDPHNSLPALDRACELVELLDAGDVMDGTIVDAHVTDAPHRVPFLPAWINRFLDTHLSAEQMQAILEKLGCRVENGEVATPSWRPDLEGKADIAEEIARFFGYDRIESAPLPGGTQGRFTEKQHLQRSVGAYMRALGASEIMTYSFTSPKVYDKIRLPQGDPRRKSVTIRNPLGEDTSVMRTTALASMLEVLARNYNNRNPQACLYELASEYLPTQPDKLPQENCTLLCGLYGEGKDFFTAKGMVEVLLEKLGLRDWDVVPCTTQPSYHPGRCAAFTCQGEQLGLVGELHPEVLENYGIGVRAYCFALDTALLQRFAATDRHYHPLPKFPAVPRDLALVCDDALPVRTLEKAIQRGVGSLLESLELFDVYRGEQLGGDKKSVAFRLSLRSPDATLTDAQINAAMQGATAELAKEGAVLRS